MVTRERICNKFGTVVEVVDVITCTKWWSVEGCRFCGVKICFPIDKPIHREHRSGATAQPVI